MARSKRQGKTKKKGVVKLKTVKSKKSLSSLSSVHAMTLHPGKTEGNARRKNSVQDSRLECTEMSICTLKEDKPVSKNTKIDGLITWTPPLNARKVKKSYVSSSNSTNEAVSLEIEAIHEAVKIDESCTKAVDYGKLLVTACQQRFADEAIMNSLPDRNNYDMPYLQKLPYRHQRPIVKVHKNVTKALALIRCTTPSLKERCYSSESQITGKPLCLKSSPTSQKITGSPNLDGISFKCKEDKTGDKKSSEILYDANLKTDSVVTSSSPCFGYGVLSFSPENSNCQSTKQDNVQFQPNLDLVTVPGNLKIKQEDSFNLQNPCDNQNIMINTNESEMMSSGKEEQNTELFLSSSDSDLLVCKKQDASRSDRKMSSKKRSVQTTEIDTCRPGKIRPNISEDPRLVTKPHAVKCKAGKCESRDGTGKDKVMVMPKNEEPATLIDSAGTLILTRSMIKTPGTCTSLLLPDDGTSSRKRQRETKELWRNVRLEQHACILWSSEQKRRFQQENPDAKSEELDEIMRNYWKTMNEKECQRYIQRARNAMNDRNNCSSRRPNMSHPGLGYNVGRHMTDCSGDTPKRKMSSFFRMGPFSWNNVVNSAGLSMEQRSKSVQTKLKYLQRNLSRTQYQKFVREFYTSLAENKKNSEDQQNICHNQQQQQQQQQQDTDNNEWQQKMSETALKIIQKLIQDKETDLTADRWQDRAVKHRRLMEKYQSLIGQLTSGSEISSLDEVRSDKLTEILDDLEGLEKPSICEAEIGDHPLDWEDNAKINALANSLSSGMTLVKSEMNDSVDDSLPTVADVLYQKILLYEVSSQPCLHQLLVQDIEDCCNGSLAETQEEEWNGKKSALLPSDFFLMDALSRIFCHLGGIEACCELESPSCILSDLLIASKLLQLENTSHLDESIQEAGLHQTGIIEDPGVDQKHSWLIPEDEFNETRSCLRQSQGPVSFKLVAPGAMSSNSDHYLMQESDHDGIFGVDTWMTTPIVRYPVQESEAICIDSDEEEEMANSGTLRHLTCSPSTIDPGNAGFQSVHATTSNDLGPWVFHEDNEEFSFLRMLHENADISNIAD